MQFYMDNVHISDWPVLIEHSQSLDPRRFILGNLTSLTTLDISHNSLTDGKITEARWGGPLGEYLDNSVQSSITFYIFIIRRCFAQPNPLLSGVEQAL